MQIKIEGGFSNDHIGSSVYLFEWHGVYTDSERASICKPLQSASEDYSDKPRLVIDTSSPKVRFKI